MSYKLVAIDLDGTFVEKEGHNQQIHKEIDNAKVKVVNLEEIIQEFNCIKILFSAEDLYEKAEEVYP